MATAKPKIYLYNTMSRRREEFQPLKNDYVRIYDCGPTVYDYAHIGNLWRYLASDFLRRILEYNGYRVKQVMNITDVGHLTEDDLLAADTGEDKMEVAARREKKTPLQVAAYYTKAYFRDRRALNILDPHVVPKATEHIGEMIKIIQGLEKRGYAYHLPDRICYDVKKFKNYGRLSGTNLGQLRVGARLEPIKGKKNPYDFSLWILDPHHLMKWNSPWGVGYPGWHIECSAMSMKYLGPQLDIHSGGEDNIFPHHENEIAQSEAYTGKRFVHYWFHVRHNLVDGQKMSKSKGNFYRLADLEKRGYEPLAYRYLALTNHYRKPLNFTFSALAAAQKALQKMRLLVWQWRQETEPAQKLSRTAHRWQQKFLAAINNDVGTPQGLSIAWQVISSNLPVAEKLALVLDFDRVFGLKLGEWRLQVPPEIKKLAQEREKWRREGEYQKADQLRIELAKKGWEVQDRPRGPLLLPRLPTAG